MPKTRSSALQIEVEINAGSETKKIKKILYQKSIPDAIYLALEGCGVRGTAYAGALKVLEEYGLLADIEAIAGTSAGAIASLIVALGFTAKEGGQILYDLPLKKFMEGSDSWSTTPAMLRKLRQSLSVVFGKDHSLSSGQAFLAWLETEIVAKRFDEIFKEKNIPKAGKDATFRDLADLIEETKKDGKSPFKYLYIPATNLEFRLPECDVFSHETTPDMRLADAVRMSGGFPFMFKLYKGHADGGMKKNLPADVFDEERFWPKGYKNEKFANPRTLSIKVDKKEEIEQFIWGIYKKRNLDGASAIGEAVYNAVSENTDIRKLREARLVLPLEDGNVETLEFTIDNHGKVKLISSAEKVTQEFLENYVSAAYFAKSYDDIEHWLADMDIPELIELLAGYVEMRKALSENKNETKPELLVNGMDEDQPTLREVDGYIRFLEDYLAFRTKKEIDPEYRMEIKFPEKHVNLKPAVSERRWDNRVINAMKLRLEGINKEIQIIQQKIEQNYFYLTKEALNLPKLHTSPYFESIKQLTGYRETLKFLHVEKQDLENKLNIKTEKSREKKKSIESIEEASLRKERSAKNEFFYAKMQELISDKAVSPALKGILKDLDLLDPSILYRSKNETDNVSIMLDLRNLTDRKIFFIALFLYLDHKKATKDREEIRSIFNAIYPDSPITELKSMQDLARILNQKEADFYVSAYRTEELLHWFASRDPKPANIVCIDTLLGMPSDIVADKKPKGAKEVDMKNIFRPFLSEDRSVSSTNLNLFRDSKKDSVPTAVPDNMVSPPMNLVTAVTESNMEIPPEKKLVNTIMQLGSPYLANPPTTKSKKRSVAQETGIEWHPLQFDSDDDEEDFAYNQRKS